MDNERQEKSIWLPPQKEIISENEEEMKMLKLVQENVSNTKISKTPTKTVFSNYQNDIFDFLKNGNGNGVVNAVAGSGKTTTLVRGASFDAIRHSNSRFVAFTRTIANELQARLGKNMEASTCHSLAYGMTRGYLRKKLQVEQYKYYDILKDMHPEMKKEARSVAIKVINYLQLTYSEVTAANIEDISLRYGIDISSFRDLYCEEDEDEERPGEDASDDETNPRKPKPNIVKTIKEAMNEGHRQAKKCGVVTFNDMLYYAVRWGEPYYTYDFLFVDECQDLSRVQNKLLKMCAGNGRVVGVGDPNQAIFGFAGAGDDSFYEFAESFDADEYPLSICYRCPTSHIKLAQEIVPQIESAPGAIEGQVDHIKKKMLPSVLMDGDLILCRATAPLVKLCLELVVQDCGVTILGKKIGQQLSSIARQSAKKKGFSFFEFPLFLRRFCRMKMDRLIQDGRDSLAETVADQQQAILYFYNELNTDNLKQFCKAMESLFSDQPSPIRLATVHKAKGLEADNVYILCPEKMPLMWKNQQAWEYQQEMNIKYVALTRAKKELWFVEC